MGRTLELLVQQQDFSSDNLSFPAPGIFLILNTGRFHKPIGLEPGHITSVLSDVWQHPVNRILGVGHKAARDYGVGFGAPTLELMRQIKTLFDPNDILNPGKILGADGAA